MPTRSFDRGRTSDSIHFPYARIASPVVATDSSSRPRSGPARFSLPVASITWRNPGSRVPASREISDQILMGVRMRPFVSSRNAGERSSRPMMLSSRRGSGAKARMKSGKSASPTVWAPCGIDCQRPSSSDPKIQSRNAFRRTPRSTRLPGERPFRSIASTRRRYSTIPARSSSSASAVPFGIRSSRPWIPMYVAKIGFHSTYQSTTSFARPSTSASGIRWASQTSPFSLVACGSRGDPTAALVPAEVAEVLGPLELLRGEDRPVHAYELVVEGTRVAHPDPALHVPLEARLDRDAELPREVDPRFHHPLGSRRQDPIELLPLDELLGQGRHEPFESSGAVVRRDVDLPARVCPFDEQELVRGLRADRGHDPGALLRERLDRGDHRGHPAPSAAGEDLLPLQPKHVAVRPTDADPVARVKRREDVRRVPVVADRDALHRPEVRHGQRGLVVPRDPDHQELTRLTAEIRAKAVRHGRRRLPHDLEERDDLDPRHGRPRSPPGRSGTRRPPGGTPSLS